MYPIGTLSFWCQQIAAGRQGLLTQVGLETYVDPRQGGGGLNAVTPEEMVSLVNVAGIDHLWYRAFPIDVAIVRGSSVDEQGNLSLENEAVTMNVLYQAIAAKRSGGTVIVQAKRIVSAGSIHPRMISVPGILVDAIVVDPDQHLDEMSPELDWLKVSDRTPRPPSPVLAASNKEAWRHWMHQRYLNPEAATPSSSQHAQSAIAATNAPVLEVRPHTADGIIARRAALELQDGALVNIGTGLPSRDLLPVTIEEEIESNVELSVETGLLGGFNNGVGFRSNVRAILDTPGIFSVYGSGLPVATFLSMLEFDEEGSVNLLRYGDTYHDNQGGELPVSRGTAWRGCTQFSPRNAPSPRPKDHRSAQPLTPKPQGGDFRAHEITLGQQLLLPFPCHSSRSPSARGERCARP